MKLKEILSLIPFVDLVEFASELLKAGVPKEDVADVVAEMLDMALQFNVIIPGPIGMALEAADGPVFKALVGVIVSFAKKKNK